MTDEEIELLRFYLRSFRIVWMPDSDTAKTIISIGMARDQDDPEGEPAAFFARGRYVALLNCELKDFKIVSDLGSHPISKEKNS